VLAEATTTFVGSAHIRTVVEEVCGHVERVHEVPPGVDVEEWRPQPREDALATSFGFARGMPPLADLMFDMRYLDNPHWIPELRDQTGLDAPVAGYIAANPAFAPSFEQIAGLLRTLLPQYAKQGRGYVNIAFGCTGGRHRSVYAAEAAAEVLRDAGFSPTVIHRNLGTRPADELERR